MSKSIAKLISLSLIFNSCGTFVSRHEIEKSKKISIRSLTKAPVIAEIPVDSEVTSVDTEFIKPVLTDDVTNQYSSASRVTETPNETGDVIDLKIDYEKKHYDFWINYFSTKDKERFERFVVNGSKYRNIINEILDENNMPKDLFFVGLIESGYNTKARSHASAVGPWQFIAGTATRYGLRVDRHVDERTHIVKATQAAVGYFRDLYNIFGSWELALCAYNAGEYRVINAIRKGNTRDYKELVRLKLIPKETIYYVPKVAAARAIYESPKKFGINIPKNQKSHFENSKIIKVKKSFDLYNIAKENNVSLSHLKELNPDMKQRWIKVSKRLGQRIFIPSFGAPEFKTEEAKEVVRITSINENKKIYRVKRGDNLSVISRRLGVDIATLKKINNIRSSKIYVGQKLEVYEASDSNSKREVANSVTSYTVQRGDSLIGIAKQFNISFSELKKINAMRTNKIYVGQKLKVPEQNIENYLVKSGDNLYFISKKFGVPISEIKKFNNLASNNVLIGQVLKIPQDEG